MKMKPKTLLLTLICAGVSQFLTAQEPYYYDNETEKEYPITRDLPQKFLDKYMKSNDLKSIEFNPDTTSVYSFRVQPKSGGWMLCNSSQVEFVSESKYDLNFPEPIFGYKPFITLASQKKKTYFYSIIEDAVMERLWFDEIEYYKIPHTVLTSNEDGTEREDSVEYVYFAALKRKNKWAIVYLDIFNYNRQVYQVTPFSYTTKGDLPITEISHYLPQIEDWKRLGYKNQLHVLNGILLDGEYVDIEFNRIKEGLDRLCVRLKDKNGVWSIYHTNYGLIHQEGFSFQKIEDECGQFATMHQKGKQYFLSLNLYNQEGFYFNENLWFDDWEYHFYEMHTDFPLIDETGMMQYDSNDNSLMGIDTASVCDYIMLKRDDKWAMAFYSTESYRFYQLTGFHFNSKEELPDSIFTNFYWPGEYEREYYLEQIEVIDKYLQENEEMDLASYIGTYSYSESEFHNIVMARHADTKRWSVQVMGAFSEDMEFPIAASKIEIHSYDDYIILETWCDDKVGYYYYNGKNIRQILPCEYTDFEYVNLDYTMGCAVEKDGYWELYSAEEQKKLVEGKSKSVDGLIDLWLNR